MIFKKHTDNNYDIKKTKHYHRESNHPSIRPSNRASCSSILLINIILPSTLPLFPSSTPPQPMMAFDDPDRLKCNLHKSSQADSLDWWTLGRPRVTNWWDFKSVNFPPGNFLAKEVSLVMNIRWGGTAISIKAYWPEGGAHFPSQPSIELFPSMERRVYTHTFKIFLMVTSSLHCNATKPKSFQRGCIDTSHFLMCTLFFHPVTIIAPFWLA